MDWFMFFCVFIVSIMAKNVDGYHLQGRIIDGNEAKLRQFPYHASLYKIKDQNYFCGGAIINRRFILSTAHCFFNNKRRSAESIFALAGQVDLKRRTNTRLKFARICLHAQFNPKYNWNDIALLQTTDNIIFTEYVRPIALPKLNIVGEVSAVVSGFGSILPPILGGAPRLSDILQYQKTTTIDSAHCVQQFDRRSFRSDKKYINVVKSIDANVICTKNSAGRGACIGDSGGPFVSNKTLIGIVSWSIACAEGHPDVYTRIYPYLDWIRREQKVALKTQKKGTTKGVS